MGLTALPIDRTVLTNSHRQGGQPGKPTKLQIFHGWAGNDGRNVVSLRPGLAGQLAKMLSSEPSSTLTNLLVMKLVQAVADDDIDEIDRLPAEAVAIDAEAPSPLYNGRPELALSRRVPKIAMTPLLPAVINKRRRAVACQICDTRLADEDSKHQSL